MPYRFHTFIFVFFIHCYKQKKMSSLWKISNTILLYEKKDLTTLSNHRPMASANTF
jgi:hypothetical protein